MDSLCIRCKGKGLCGQPCKILSRFIDNSPKPTLHFSGKSSPEIFVGRVGYPTVNSGILAPSENDNVSNFATAEEWSKNNFSIANVLRLRGQLIYGKSVSNIKIPDKIKQITQELALSSKPVLTEVFLKKKPTLEFTSSSVFMPMTNPAPIKRAILEENPKVSKRVDYITSDSDIKAVDAITELYNSKSKVDHLQKLLSIGLLGKKANRRMVPTRWSITATDDIISKNQLEKIRYYPKINNIMVLSGNFLGNYIEALLLPANFSFEVIEAWISGNVYVSKTEFSSDYEGFNGRKSYATNVTGGYYASRIATTEYLEKIKRQAAVFILREIRPEYYAPLGVGIVRETARRTFAASPKYFDSIEDAFKDIQSRLTISIEKIKQDSWLLNNYNKQRTLDQF